MEEARDYQVNLEVFQGPLDLLLFLIRKKKIDIHDIPIATITKEYLAYLNLKEKINLEREGEFLLIAALLIHIKSQMLLPRESELEDEEAVVMPAALDNDWQDELGLSLERLSASARTELSLDDDVVGVVVESVEPGGAAAEAGLRPGDVIEQVGDTHIEAMNDFRDALDGLDRDRPVVLRVTRGPQKLFLAMVLPE